MPAENESRPGGGTGAAESFATDESQPTPDRCRCIVCGRRLSARESVRLGVGPRCWIVMLLAGGGHDEA